ncbi:MAG: VOC family protein [Acidimicrobiia bacterium]
MPIHRLNHAVLYVRDAQRSADFYGEVLGFRQVMRMPRSGPAGAIFLQAEGSSNDHDLGLFSVGQGAAPSEAGRRTVGLYHLAWEVDTLDDLERVSAALAERGALVGASDHGSTKAVYARDPDGIEFEVSWLVPAELLDDEVVAARSTIKPLDIAREKARYGGDRLGGVGVSRPAVPA